MLLQGHAQTTRAIGSSLPCPQVDFTGGFNDWFAAAYGLPEGTTVADRYGAAFDPFMNDQNYLLCVVSTFLWAFCQNPRSLSFTGHSKSCCGLCGHFRCSTSHLTPCQQL